MKAIQLVTSILAALMMYGCGPLCSLHPLWDGEHLVAEPGLVGRWLAEDDDAVLVVEDDGAGKYRFTYLGGHEVGRYEVHAVRLANRLFLDYGPDEATLQARLQGEDYAPIIPAHLFVRAELGENVLRMAILDNDAVEEKLSSGEWMLPVCKSEDNELLLTADTSALQGFVAAHAEDSSMWEDVSVFHRR